MTGLKVGRNIYNIDDKDIVLFNGACWILLTRKVFGEWRNACPTISKTLCQKLLKKGVLKLVKKEKEYITRDGKQMGLYYYKFDIKKLEEYLQKSNKKGVIK